jgi:transposase InsO family protein
MPWQETDPVDQRSRFLDAFLAGGFSFTELCERAQVSRKTGYKWIARYDAEGRAGLADRSRAPHHCPHRIEPAVAALIVSARRKHPDWGPGKLLDWLAPRHPDVEWPAVSTAGDLLKREGLIKRRRPRYRPEHPGVVPPVTHAPNDLWTADFKGHFRTGDGRYCYPLTILDLHSRYLLTCHGLRSTESRMARPIFERAFREYGLPAAIRTDNGVPFATTGLHGLSLLSVWWIRLGIMPQRILPAHPEQNGAHERMHKTLKRGAIRPPRATLGAQQRAFTSYRTLYNEERPHDALDGTTPAAHYRSSPRAYPAQLPAIEYPGHFVVKRITGAGTFRFKERLFFLSNALDHHHVGLEEVDDGLWSVHFCHLVLARIDERTGTLTRG